MPASTKDAEGFAASFIYSRYYREISPRLPLSQATGDTMKVRGATPSQGELQLSVRSETEKSHYSVLAFDQVDRMGGITSTLQKLV